MSLNKFPSFEQINGHEPGRITDFPDTDKYKKLHGCDGPGAWRSRLGITVSGTSGPLALLRVFGTFPSETVQCVAQNKCSTISFSFQQVTASFKTFTFQQLTNNSFTFKTITKNKTKKNKKPDEKGEYKNKSSC